MNFLSFSIFTVLGAGIWNAILALAGYLAHGQADLINKYSKEIGYFVIIALVLVAVYFAVKYFIRKKGSQKK